ncbi:sugar-binding transcriptional regulator [Ruania halotolerans]|uniref:sugar-binding transcriptional regulator n=1 Tax=Ruania halotolerans TaxID=2897773 RepID=UPI001E47DB35|nr:sugar-binding domain-containing protein [Ruania halotolerans]UFU05399.1 Cro/Cl family transcriptional regulator [Ruania halotolerans]
MDHSELILMRDVSIDFHLEGKSKVEIAKERDLSRFQVARLLSSARDLGIVRIAISLPEESDSELGAQLSAELGVDVSISPSHSDVGQRRELLARTVARAVRDRVREGMTVGMSWSRTIEAAAQYIDQLAPCEIVQLVGAQPVQGSGDSLELIQRFKAMPGVRTWPIWAPLVVRDAATATGLREQPQIAEALAKAGSLDLAVVAIGGWSRPTSTVYPNLSDADLEAARAGGTVGECSGRLFDADGREVQTPLDERVVAVTLEQLRRTPEVIACGFGAPCAPAVRAAVRGGFASALVLDAECAQAMVAVRS